jgi:cellulose synthase/poly-beta-1,6-N-acetylglucosamine synthase-like glycosyltransferase
MPLTLLTIIFLTLYAILILFYYGQWKKAIDYLPSVREVSTKISVIIAARNEEKHLPLLLQDLIKQDYPSHLFEVIVVNDFSTDATATVMELYHQSNFKMILPGSSPETSSKKKAINTGINEANGELIIVTDADCRVTSSWVSIMTAFYKEKDAAFIAAPVKFSHNNSLLQIFQSLDFITLQGITAASVSSGFHNMCNGANLAYTKKSFKAVNGFEGIDKIASGDDMLLMHKIGKQQPQKIFYLKSKQAIVSTAPALTWKDFFMQRRRWASKTMVYNDYRIIVVLAFILLYNGLFFVLLIASFFHEIYWIHLVAFLTCKTIIEWPFVYSVSKFYGEQRLMRYFIFIQPLHIFYTVFVGVWSQFGKYEWKGRRTR